MSGIAAILRLDGAPSDLGAAAASSDRLGPSAIEAMIDALAHRGPDGRSAAVIGPAALGHTLFAATDEDALDAQPLRRGPRAVVADARLDNRRELIGELCSPGEDEPSDAALILHAYERWGEACPSHLTGDFAFVLWDDERHLLLAARDAIGIRPLYYHHDRRALRCASEMLALFAGGEVDKRPHRPSLALWLNGGYSERDQTLYDRVFSLPAGHALVARDGAVDVRRYWWPDPWRQIRYATDAEYADHFGAVFREAVRCRLRARGPVAVVVSGGLDSSSIACEADRLRRAGLAASDPLVLLHLAFPGLPCDEQRYSDAVGERCGTPMIDVAPMDDVELCRPDPSRLLPDVYFHPTVSMFDPLLAEAKARGARVALTGMGGDDLMEGTGWDFSYMIAEGQLRDAAEYVGLTERPLARETWEAVWSYGVRPFIPASVRRIGRKVLPRRTLPWLSREVSEEAWQLAADQARRDAERDYPSRVAPGVDHGRGRQQPARAAALRPVRRAPGDRLPAPLLRRAADRAAPRLPARAARPRLGHEARAPARARRNAPAARARSARLRDLQPVPRSRLRGRAPGRIARTFPMQPARRPRYAPGRPRPRAP